MAKEVVPGRTTAVRAIGRGKRSRALTFPKGVADELELEEGEEPERIELDEDERRLTLEF